MCVDSSGIFENCDVCVRGGFFTNSSVCVKMRHYISHLPLSLTVGVHPPWSLLGYSISAVI